MPAFLEVKVTFTLSSSLALKSLSFLGSRISTSTSVFTALAFTAVSILPLTFAKVPSSALTFSSSPLTASRTVFIVVSLSLWFANIRTF